MLFDRAIEFVERTPDRVAAAFADAIASNTDILKHYLVDVQMYEQGIDGNGHKLVNALVPGRVYARVTIARKKRKGQPTDRVTLRDSGKFHLSIEIKAESEGFVITSNVDYDKYLLGYYGKNILKITNANMQDFIYKFVIPKIKLHGFKTNK